MTPELEQYKPVAEAISLLFFPHVEVIVHDFKTKSIGAIYNNFSKRKIGDESLLDDTEKLLDQDVFHPYFKINSDGRKLKSVSAVLKNIEGVPIGLLCINLDVSKWEQMHRMILGLIESNIEKPDFLFKNDWREKINTYVSSYLDKKGLCMEAMNRSEKKDLLIELWKEGAFNTKNAAAYVADVLQISRATVYNYLKEKA
jgi:D-arginine utilization repressor